MIEDSKFENFFDLNFKIYYQYLIEIYSLTKISFPSFGRFSNENDVIISSIVDDCEELI